MTVFPSFRRIFWCGLLGLIALLIVLGLFSRMERTPLPNGLELGHRYFWDGRNGFYLWTKEGDLVAPYVIDLMCYNDHYIEVSTMGGPTFFVYDIDDDVLTVSTDKQWRKRSREIGLNCSPEGTNGYTQFLVGAGIVVNYPEVLRDCTLSAPCGLEEK